MHGYPIIIFISTALAKICFSIIALNCAKISMWILVESEGSKIFKNKKTKRYFHFSAILIRSLFNHSQWCTYGKYFNSNSFYADCIWWQFSLCANLLKMLDKIVLFENQAFKPKKDRFSANLLWANLWTVPTNTEVFLRGFWLCEKSRS